MLLQEPRHVRENLADRRADFAGEPGPLALIVNGLTRIIRECEEI
jgi:hypothetical protein